MPWMESSVVEERLKFVVLASQGDRNVSALCQEFGISRQTGYLWLKRYQAGGAAEITDRSRRPKNSPKRTASETEQYIVSLREKWPDWGAPKLLEILRREKPEWGGISERTVHRVLDRNGLILDEDRPSRPANKRFEREHPNDLWQMDFKGPQGFNNGSVGPLSILDDHSRYLIELRHLGSTKLSGVRETLQRVFEEAGQPAAMLVDHGTPWWNAVNPWGLTELSVWIMRHGIRLYYSGISHPQTQGKVERMHEALQQAIHKRKGDPTQQPWLDGFKCEYNFVRPHEALQMATPSSRWRPSDRRFQPQPPEWDYAPTMHVVQLAGAGQLNWQGRRWEISAALRRQRVGIQVIGNRAIVYYCNTPVRDLDLSKGTSSVIRLDAIHSLQH